MERFELAYRLPDNRSHLVTELLPTTDPEYEWSETRKTLVFYYKYDFLPAGVMPRFIVLTHKLLKTIDKQSQLCWREGAVLEREKNLAYVKVKPLERLVEIKIQGRKGRELLSIIRNTFDHINSSIKNIKIREVIPCTCSKNCPHKFIYKQLLFAENIEKEKVDCPVTWEPVPLFKMLEGYESKPNRKRSLKKKYKDGGLHISVIQEMKQKSIQIAKQKQESTQKTVLDIKTDLPSIQDQFSNLAELICDETPVFEKRLHEIVDNLDEVGPDTKKEKFIKPFNKLGRFLREVGNEESGFRKTVTGTEQVFELAQSVGKIYNKFAPWIGLPPVPKVFLE